MSAAYQLVYPSRTKTRATSFFKENDYEQEIVRDVTSSEGKIFSYVVQGTMGLLTPEFLQASFAATNWIIHIQKMVADEPIKQLMPNSESHDIVYIRKTFKISVTELARIFGVSRQAVHDWIKGETLSERNSEKLSELVEVAKIFTISKIDVAPQMLRRKISGGHSLLELLRDGNNIAEEARKLVETLLREADQGRRLTARLAGRKIDSPSIDGIGLPHLREDV